MKKHNNILITVIILSIIAALVGATAYFVAMPDPNDPIVSHDTLPNQLNTEIELGEETNIDSLSKIPIAGTNDTLEITSAVKWEIPEHEPDETISFAILIPYTFTVNGVEYSGEYHLGDSAWNRAVEGLKYNLNITNLTSDGILTVVVTKK